MATRLKDIYFTKESMAALADSVARRCPDFDRDRFLSLALDDGWEARELKDRMRHTARCLREFLPAGFREALLVLRDVAPEVKGFEAMALPDFVEQFGLDDWEASLPALGWFTRFGSSEFAIRPFLDRDPTRTLGWMSRWAQDEDWRVRRLASEGCRPRLPWAMALPRFQVDPAPLLPILERLKDDPSEDVRRSVSNNLNDISKDHPQVVLDLVERWLGKSAEVDRMLKHACRTLLKRGDERAMRLFGFEEADHVHIEGLRVEPQVVPIGGEILMACVLVVESDSTSPIRIEYAVAYAKARGKSSRKVFQHSERVYPAGRHPIRKRHAMADMSTRKHYAGPHRITLIVNGKEHSHVTFDVVEE